MDIVSEQKDALAAIGLTALGFILLVVTTTSHEYGLMLAGNDRLVWSVTRMLPALGWISLAGVLVLFRDTISWASAATAFLVTLAVGSSVAVFGVSAGIDALSVMSTVSYYALISALLCLTIKSRARAAVAGPFLLALQVLTDIAAHVGAGVLQIAW